MQQQLTAALEGAYFGGRGIEEEQVVQLDGGFIGSVYRVKDGQGGAIVKLCPALDAQMPELGLHARERTFYAALRPRVEKALDASVHVIPQCYEHTANYLILEDLASRGLTVSGGATLADGLPLGLALQAVGMIGAVHRVFSSVRSPDAFEELIGAFAEAELPHDNFEFGVAAYTEAHEGLTPELADVLPVSVAKELPSRTRALPKERTMMSGDLWSGNFLFSKEEEGKVGLIDFQFTGIASPLIDLTFLLYSSVSGDILDKHMGELLEAYGGDVNRDDEMWHVALQWAFIVIVASRDIFDEPTFAARTAYLSKALRATEPSS